MNNYSSQSFKVYKQQGKRIPRAWWGWVIPVYRDVKDMPRFGQILLGGIVLALFMTIVL